MDLPPELQKIQDNRQAVYGDFTINMAGTSKQLDGLLDEVRNLQSHSFTKANARSMFRSC